MGRTIRILGLLAVLVSAGIPSHAQQIGKFVPIPAGSDVDKALAEINAATDPTQKLALLDKYAPQLSQGDFVIVFSELYVNVYLAQKNYDKTFEHGEKLFAADPDNLANAVSLIRAAAEKGDVDKLSAYGEKTSSILKRFKDAPAPSSMSPEVWQQNRAQTLAANSDTIAYLQQVLYNGFYQSPALAKDPGKRAALLARFAQQFPDSLYANPALGVAATSYQQAQNPAKMLEVANGLLAKDSENLGMLLLVSDYYSEKNEQLDKAEAYAKKAITLLAAAKKPDGVTDDQWQQQTSLQKGLALSSLGQINMQKKETAQGVQNFRAAAPLVKADAFTYARNQCRLGSALISLKRMPEAKEAFSQAASVNSPYKSLAQDKLKSLAASAKKGTS